MAMNACTRRSNAERRRLSRNAISRFERPCAYDTLSGNHQGANGHQRLMPETEKKIHGVQNAVISMKRKKFESYGQADKDQEAGGFQWNFLAGKQNQCKHRQHQNGRGMSIRG